jgi:5-methylcytosine-specific restriction protein A
MIFDESFRNEHIRRERAKARELRASQWWRQQIGPGLCHHCGGKFDKTELTMDHLIPLARGGKTAKGNVVPSCRNCNASRGHVLDVERTLAQMEDGE